MVRQGGLARETIPPEVQRRDLSSRLRLRARRGQTEVHRLRHGRNQMGHSHRFRAMGRMLLVGDMLVITSEKTGARVLREGGNRSAPADQRASRRWTSTKAFSTGEASTGNHPVITRGPTVDPQRSRSRVLRSAREARERVGPRCERSNCYGLARGSTFKRWRTKKSRRRRLPYFDSPTPCPAPGNDKQFKVLVGFDERVDDLS